jgi:hypothetical protein
MSISTILTAFGVLLLAACSYEQRIVVLLQLSGSTPLSAEGEHYELWVDVAEGAAQLTCFRLEVRAPDCANGRSEDGVYQAVETETVVACECPCTGRQVNPCIAELAERGIAITDDGRSFTAGRVIGTSSHTVTGQENGGVELPTTRDLALAQRLYVTRKESAVPAAGPGDDVLMSGALFVDGQVLRGRLEPQSADGADGYTTIIPTGDETAW